MTGTLRGEAPEFVPSANPLLAPMQTPGSQLCFAPDLATKCQALHQDGAVSVGYPPWPVLPFSQPPVMSVPQTSAWSSRSTRLKDTKHSARPQFVPVMVQQKGASTGACRVTQNASLSVSEASQRYGIRKLKSMQNPIWCKLNHI